MNVERWWEKNGVLGELIVPLYTIRNVSIAVAIQSLQHLTKKK